VVKVGEWENLEIERLSRLADSMGWMVILSEILGDKINVKMERKIPIEIIRIREEVAEKEGLPT